MEVKAAGCSPCWGVSPDHSPEALPGPCLPQAQALLTPVHSQQLRQGSVLIKQSLICFIGADAVSTEFCFPLCSAGCLCNLVSLAGPFEL